MLLTILTNSSVRAAPPSYYFPDERGIAVPTVEAASRWMLLIDQTNVPDGAEYSIAVEYQRNTSWTHPSGEIHPAGEWLEDLPGPFLGGHFDGPYGPNVNWLASHFGWFDPDHNLLAPIPDFMRLRIDSVDGSWVFPTISFQVT